MSRRKKFAFYAYALLAGTALVASGCTRLMGGLRHDLDDSDPYAGAPTVGGQWSERGFLGNDLSESGPYGDRYGSVGHSERNPASADSAGPVGSGSWISAEREDENRRDGLRGTEMNPDDEGAGATYSSAKNVNPQAKRSYKNGNRATRADFIDESPSEGSLWASDGQTNYYFTKNKIRGVGDIITVKMDGELLKDLGNEVRRTLSPRERTLELAKAQDRLNAKANGLPEPDGVVAPSAPGADALATTAAAPDRAPASDTPKLTRKDGTEPVEGRPAGTSDIDVMRALEVKPGDVMLAEIVERYPNGNYKIRGTKRIIYKNGTPRLISLVGIARGSDISEEDVVNSGKLYEYQLESLR